VMYWRDRLACFCCALESEESRTGAMDAIRALIDTILLEPDGDQLKITLKGDLAGMLSAARDSKRSPETGDLLLQIKLVAGARNQRYSKSAETRCQLFESRTGRRQCVPRHAEFAAKVRVRDHRRRQNIVAGRLHAVGDPVHQVGEPTLHLARRKAAVVDVPDGARHQLVGVAVRGGAASVDLLHRERHEKIAQGVHGQHRYREPSRDRRDGRKTLLVPELWIEVDAEDAGVQRQLLGGQ